MRRAKSDATCLFYFGPSLHNSPRAGQKVTTMDKNDMRAKIAERLCTHYFNEEGRRSPGFGDMLARQVERVLKVAEVRASTSPTMT